ncbi:MAG: flagellar motor switch phosphatase FliY [Sporolactobacillus sp.]
MSDGKLTQEEIDALLGNHPQEDEKPKSEQADAEEQKQTASAIHQGSNATHPDDDDTMSELEEDVLGEIGNISFGSAATALSTCLNQKVEITTPVVSVVHKKDLADEFPVPYVSVRVNYTEGFEGSCMLVIKITDASIIANLMMGGDGKNPSSEISEMEMSAVQEAMNQMMGSSSTAMSTVFSRRIDISPPELTLMDVRTRRGMDYIPSDEVMFEISFQLRIGKLVDSNIMLVIPVRFGKALVDLLIDANQSSDNDSEVESVPTSVDAEAASPSAIEQSPRGQVDPIERDKPKRDTEKQELNKQIAARDVQPLEFSSFDQRKQATSSAVPRNLNLLMDIPLDVSVELGHTSKTVKEVLELGPGSIIELDKLAGEAIDILVNQKYIAKGEVVVVDENFGIRITEILDHYDRIKNL